MNLKEILKSITIYDIDRYGNNFYSNIISSVPFDTTDILETIAFDHYHNYVSKLLSYRFIKRVGMEILSNQQGIRARGYVNIDRMKDLIIKQLKD